MKLYVCIKKAGPDQFMATIPDIAGSYETAESEEEVVAKIIQWFYDRNETLRAFGYQDVIQPSSVETLTAGSEYADAKWKCIEVQSP